MVKEVTSWQGSELARDQRSQPECELSYGSKSPILVQEYQVSREEDRLT